MTDGFMLGDKTSSPNDAFNHARTAGLDGCRPQDLRAIARHLESVAAAIEAGSTKESPRERQDQPGRADRDRIIEIARQIYLSREMRWKIIGGHLLGEPAWDILLDLFYQDGIGRRVTTTETQYAAHAPAATSLRYLERLEQDGLVLRKASRRDRRTRYVELTDKGRSIMKRYLSAMVDYTAISDVARAENFVRGFREAKHSSSE